GVGVDGEPAALGDRVHQVRIALDDDKGNALLVQVVGDDPSDAAVAADDEVVANVIEHAYEAAFLEAAVESALDDRRGEQCGRVKGRADAAEDQDDGEDLADARQRVDFAKANGSHRGHRHVERVPRAP